LRAPWAGLSLADLSILAEIADPAASVRAMQPIPSLLAERIHLLSPEGRAAAQRVLRAVTAASGLRAAQPAAALGTWLQQVWRLLGGESTLDPTARANVDLLFARLDQLPNSDLDLIGPALDAALKDLKALPDPQADPEFGVQLMTIHKSKGLEFEVVIVPDLQLPDRNTKTKMLSWLERGLAPDKAAEGSGELTEFLIAPMQSKGSKKGSAKEVVEQARKLREQQESRRLLYVAATRARDQLHLFARPEIKTEKDGSLVLAEPSSGLLATAWPALEDEIRRRFLEWKSQQAAPPAPEQCEAPQPGELFALAAQADTNLLHMPSSQPTRLRRLPPDFSSQGPLPLDVERLLSVDLAPAGDPLYTRHEGGLESRALGTAVHALLQQLARLRASSNWPAARAALPQFAPRIQALLRSAGIDPAQAPALTAQAMRLALDASNHAAAAWILSPHPQAACELRWTGVLEGAIHSVQIDRIFLAGPVPLSQGDSVWWIVDYKTARAPAPDSPAPPDVTALRPLYAHQLELYARVLRNLHGADAAVRAGLYYPRMAALDWWEL
jgi:ATP-dependent exoDNAse (exonuclease V) beta subunit